MADRRRRDGLRAGGDGGLAARLRRDAGATRPAFSVALHERVCAAVADTMPPAPARPPHRGRRLRWATLAGGLAAVACIAALVGGGWRAPVAGPPPGAAWAATDGPGIERLPTPGEIGEGVLAEVTTLAAAAVGVPALTDLAAFDPAGLVAADDARP